MSIQLPRQAPSVFSARRNRLVARIGDKPVLVCAGHPRPRNYAANIYRYRSDSHFLYLAGAHMAGAVLVGCGGRWEVFAHPEDPSNPLWHGDQPGWDEVVSRTGVSDVRPLHELEEAIEKLGGKGAFATIPSTDTVARRQQACLLGRPWGDDHGVPELS